MIYCPTCKAELPGDANFCFKCGYDIASIRTQIKQSQDFLSQTLDSKATIRLSGVESLGEEKTAFAAKSGSAEVVRYEILSELGSGGMGSVYRARDRRLHRTVALKRLLTSLSGSQRAIDRFFNEARSIASLSHPNIVQVYDFGEDTEGHYIAMEYVEGTNLKEYLKEKGRLKAAEATRIILSVARGLASAHERGVIHRDIKPANVLITPEGVPKLTDFGLARVTDTEEMTRTGLMMGTPDYCSPEQLKDAKGVDHRTDIYSLGATLYEMVTGESPKYYREESIPAGMRAIVKKAMAPEPAGRYQGVSEFLEAFEAEEVEESTGLRAACPECGWSNPMDVKFCLKCGNDLSQLFEKCPKCRRENRMDVEFCGSCGYSLYNFRRIQKLKGKALKLRGEHRYEDALEVWGRILEIEEANREARQGKEADLKTIQNIEGLAEEIEKAAGSSDHERVLGKYEELVSLQPAYEGEFAGIRAEATKGWRLKKAREETERFYGGPSDGSGALQAWEEYKESTDSEEERGAADTEIERIRESQKRIYELTKRLEVDFQARNYDACMSLIEQIRTIQANNDRCNKIEREIADISNNIEEYNNILAKSIQEDDYETAVDALNNLIALQGENQELIDRLAIYERNKKELDDILDKLNRAYAVERNISKAQKIIDGLGSKYINSSSLNQLKNEIKQDVSKVEEYRQLIPRKISTFNDLEAKIDNLNKIVQLDKSADTERADLERLIKLKDKYLTLKDEAENLCEQKLFSKASIIYREMRNIIYAVDYCRAYKIWESREEHKTKKRKSVLGCLFMVILGFLTPGILAFITHSDVWGVIGVVIGVIMLIIGWSWYKLYHE